MKQYNSGKFIGGILDTLNRTSVFISAGNTILIIATFYNTGGGLFIKRLLPWMNMYWFMLLALLLASLAMLFVYFVITPSYFNFYSTQFYKHDSPMKRDIEAIKYKLGIEDSGDD